jgi:hypothetical protein
MPTNDGPCCPSEGIVENNGACTGQVAPLKIIVRVGPLHPCPDMDNGDGVEAVEQHAGVDHRFVRSHSVSLAAHAWSPCNLGIKRSGFHLEPSRVSCIAVCGFVPSYPSVTILSP